MSSNLNQPQRNDAVLGGQVPAQPHSSVLGGLEGVKHRVASANPGQQIAGLTEALKYGEPGLNLLIQALQDPTAAVREKAYSLLESRWQSKNEPQVRQALQAYNPWSLYQCSHTLAGHRNAVGSVALNSVGTLLISGSWEHVVKLWDLETRREIRTLHSDKWWSTDSTAVAISPDGQKALARFSSKATKLWDLQTGKEIFTFGDAPSAFTISPNWQYLAHSVLNQCQIKVWNLQTGAEVTTIHLPSRYRKVASLVISPDSQYLIGSIYANWDSAEIALRIWNLQTGDELQTFTHRFYYAGCMLISPDGQTSVSCKTTPGVSVSGGKTSVIRVWNLQTGELIQTLSGHTSDVNCMAMSADGKIIVSGGRDKTIKIWNLQTGQELHTLTGHSDSINAVAINSTNQTLVSASSDKTIKLWAIPPANYSSTPIN